MSSSFQKIPPSAVALELVGDHFGNQLPEIRSRMLEKAKRHAKITVAQIRSEILTGIGYAFYKYVDETIDTITIEQVEDYIANKKIKK